MDLKEIRQIVDLMKKTDLTEFEIEQEGLKLRIKRGSPAGTPGSGGSHPPFLPGPADPLPGAGTTHPPILLPAGTVTINGGAASSPPLPAADETGMGYIKSPMVGTFYRSPSPESAPFIDAGARVQENTVVCIVEAMKIMNEIQAEVKGTVVESLVENGQPVEFGQKLFKVRLG